MDFETLREVMEKYIPFNRFLGVRAPVISAGFARLEIPFREELVGDPLRPALHGGVISMLADTAGGAAVWTLLEDDRGRVSTIDLRVDYLRPAKLEGLVAEAQVVRRGNRVAVVDVKVFNAGAPGDVVATGKAVYNVTLTKTRLPPA